MGVSPTPRTADPGAPDRPVVAVAFSGGLDSAALLHATVQAAREGGWHVAALHIHHGLMPEADAWAEHGARLVRNWARRGAPVSFHLHRLIGRPARGESVEAWARRERYAALAQMARAAGAGLVLLAHHRRDQAETVLLQALRGAGPAGLAAMPATVERDGLVWARPWRDQPREAIAAYARRHRLRVVDDASNADPRFARSRLRMAVWPALIEAFPEAEVALGAVAQRAAQADALARDVAQADLATCADERGLDLVRWATLTAPRRLNALRGWLATALGRGVPQALVDRLVAALPTAGRGSATWPAGEGFSVRAYRGRLTVSPPPGDLAPPRAARMIDLSACGRHEIAEWGGAVDVQSAAAGEPGVPAALLGQLRLAPRTGGEQFLLREGGLPRSLKKQFQALGVPAWSRHGPLLWAGDQLVFVPGLGLDARVLAWHGRSRRRLVWLPDPGAG